MKCSKCEWVRGVSRIVTYKQYPIGAVLLWRTREKLLTEKRLGKFELPEPVKDYPIDYVLDGQQRLTSLFSVFQTELRVEEDRDWMDIYYLIGSAAEKQKTSFGVLRNEDVNRNKQFSLNILFDTVKYRKATKEYDDETIEEIDNLQAIFKETVIPVQLMESDDKENVAIVFEN